MIQKDRIFIFLLPAGLSMPVTIHCIKGNILHILTRFNNFINLLNLIMQIIYVKIYRPVLPRCPIPPRSTLPQNINDDMTFLQPDS